MNLNFMLSVLWITLMIATIIALAVNKIKKSNETNNVLKRMMSWWVIVMLFTSLFFVGNLGVLAFFTLVSMAAIYEIFKKNRDFKCVIISILVIISMGSCVAVFKIKPELLFFLIVVTQLNDVAQYLWGKTLGKRRILPTISPSKTWEGFIGGVFTSALLTFTISAYLTPFSPMMAIIVGISLGIFGFLGDATISAFKRSINVKDMSNLIPGHGGIMDRIDSLLYNAPLFFIFIYYLYSSGTS